LVLNLSGNQIDDDGAEKLAEVILKNSQITLKNQTYTVLLLEDIIKVSVDT
jgi:hypothetical protein